MLTRSLLWIVGAVILGSLFWCSARACVTLLLVTWTIAIGIFVYSNLAGRSLWIPIMLALFGVFGSVLMLAIPADIILPANIATLALFAISVEVLRDHRRSIAPTRYRA